MGYIDTTERVGDYIVQVVADENGGAFDPRDSDNLAHIYGEHRHYTIGDGEPPSDHMRALERGGIRLLYRYLRRYEGVIAFTKIGMLDHSGVSYYTVPLDPPGRWEHPMDPGGWDSGIVGYAYVDRAGLDLMGTDEADAEEVMEAEVKEYNDWATGNVWGYTVSKPCDHADEHDDDADIADCPHAEVIESCWGFIGDPADALAEGKSMATYLMEHPADV